MAVSVMSVLLNIEFPPREIAQRLHCKRCRWPKSTKSISRGPITNELVSDKEVSVAPSEEVDFSNWRIFGAFAQTKQLQRSWNYQWVTSRFTCFGRTHGTDALRCFW
jgi:hypothetical protein